MYSNLATHVRTAVDCIVTIGLMYSSNDRAALWVVYFASVMVLLGIFTIWSATFLGKVIVFFQAPMSALEQFDGIGANYPRQPQYIATTSLETGNEPHDQNQMSDADRILSTPLRAPNQFNSNNSTALATQPCYSVDSMSTPIITKDGNAVDNQSGSTLNHPSSINSPKLGESPMHRNKDTVNGYISSNL